MSKNPKPSLPPEALARALALRDLTDPSQGPHAVQRVLDAAVKALAAAWGCQVSVHRASPVVPVATERDPGAAEEPPGVFGTHALRTRTAAMVPPLLDLLAAAPPADVLLVCPGIVFRRDADGAVRTAHEADLWRIRRGPPLAVRDLAQMIGVVARAVAPGLTPSAIPAASPRREEGRQLDVRVRGAWSEIGRCGIALPAMLAEAGLPKDASALAMTLDLDRLAMLANGIDDARLLRSEDPAVARQMLDLAPYVPALAGKREGAPEEGGEIAPFRTIEDVRASIDELDGRIVKALAERRAYALEAVRFKRPSEDPRVPVREEQVVANVRALARESGIEPDLVEELYRHLMEELVRLQRAARSPGAGRPA